MAPFQIRAFGAPVTKHQHHFGNGKIIALRETCQIGALIGDIDRLAQLLDYDIALEEERARALTPTGAAYPVLARTLAARRDNLRATIAVLERRFTKVQQGAENLA
jgi:hypothetical protein